MGLFGWQLLHCSQKVLGEHKSNMYKKFGNDMNQYRSSFLVVSNCASGVILSMYLGIYKVPINPVVKQQHNY